MPLELATIFCSREVSYRVLKRKTMFWGEMEIEIDCIDFWGIGRCIVRSKLLVNVDVILFSPKKFMLI